MHFGAGKIEVLCDRADVLRGYATEVFLNLVQQGQEFLAPWRKTTQNALQFQS